MDLEVSGSAFTHSISCWQLPSLSLGLFVRTRTCILMNFKRCCR
jgi:hypothetical protein